MATLSLTPEDVLHRLQDDRHAQVKVAVTDIDGVLRGKYMHKQKLVAALEKGFGFCDVVFGWDMVDACYDDVRVTGWHTGYPDATARVDIQTMRRVPWDDGVAFFLADFEGASGSPLGVCPRQTLRHVLERARELGYRLMAGFEYEWANLAESPQTLAGKRGADLQPLTPGAFGFSILRASQNRPYLAALMEQLAAFGVPLEGLHAETGPGVYEAAILATEGIEAADRAALFKTAVKEIAHLHGVTATFMARWSDKVPGSSGHLHQSLWDLDGDRNAFHDGERPNGMSALFEHYLAGQLQLLPDLCALYAPTVNSYKRLVEGTWAPTRVTWGIDNRTAALRAIPGQAASSRLETRLPGADANPYLVLAAALGSGLYGIEHELRLEQHPVKGNAYQVSNAPELPRTLAEATARLAGSATAREILGEDLVDHFVRTRRWEWKQFRQSVTDWELARYLEII